LGIVALAASCQTQGLDAHSRRPVRLDDERAPQFLHNHEHIDRAAAKAALRFRHRQRGEAEFGEAGPVRVRHARFGSHDRLARLEAVALLQIAAQCVGELLLFVVEVEVHAPLLKCPESSAR